MNRRRFLQGASLLAISPEMPGLRALSAIDSTQPPWLREFQSPSSAVRPWVYAFWMEGNITREGITADLSAMQAAGIGGILFMDGSLTNPPGPHRFLSDSWLAMFDWLLQEAARLGLEINLNNAPGWAGSGGPWITPELASQRVIVAESIVEGGSALQSPLQKPAGIRNNYYRDIAVLAFRAPAGGGLPAFRIPGIGTTKSFAGYGDFFGVVPWPRFIPTNPAWPEAPPDQCIDAASMLDLTAQLDSEDRLSWTAPSGRWILLRIGHTVSNGGTRSAQTEATGLECDKLSKQAAEFQFAHMVGRLSDRAGPLLGRTLVSTHIDSWEAGSGNWTEGFREEFRARRGYDLLPFLPTLNGIVVNNRGVSERFLWDYRETVSELTLENYAGHFRNLAHGKGLRLSIEAYDGTCDDLRYAGRADEPMTEFWRSCYSGLPLSDLTESMASAAHVYGRNIVGAESFTAPRGDFADHPASLKPLADWAFCTGVNRLCLSEWIMQPWPHIVPGVSFQTFGTVFHESVTWWPDAKPWHEYIARCQHMLRQGTFVADICFLTPEGGPYRFTPPIPASLRGGIPGRPGYNFDGCPAELVLQQMTVENGCVALPSGMQYRLLVLPTYNAGGAPVMRLTNTVDYAYQALPMPEVKTMTPELLRKVGNLVEAGATILGHRPLQSPSLRNYPQCDAEVLAIADHLWGENQGGSGAGERRVGKGRVVWGRTPEEVLSGIGVAPDFSCRPELRAKLNYTHRRTSDGADVYFVVNQQDAEVEGEISFRVGGKRPELFWPQNGASALAPAFYATDGVTTLPLALHANESVFVVFHLPAPAKSLVGVTRADQPLWPQAAPSETPAEEEDAFTLSLWLTPGPDIVLPIPQQGGWAYENPAIESPSPGYQTFLAPGEGYYGFSAGANGVVVFQYGESGRVEPLLVHETAIEASTLIGVVYRNRVPKLYLNGALVKTGPPSRFTPRPSRLWMDRRAFAGEIAALHQFEAMIGSQALSPQSSETTAFDISRRIVWRSGDYGLQDASGKRRKLSVDIPPPQQIDGPWQVAFDPAWGGPANVSFDALQDWSKHPNPGIRYYSGGAVYRKSFQFSSTQKHSPGSLVFLDLGEVAAVAEVRLNGKDAGVLWNRPYRIDITGALRNGANSLEILVRNLWSNRLIGDERLPADSDRGASGVVKTWPQWVLDQHKSPTGRFTFTSARQWTQDSTPLRSGLLGPVQLLMAEEIEM